MAKCFDIIKSLVQTQVINHEVLITKGDRFLNMKYNGESHTFVICAYKSSPYLDDCIQSLLNQEETTNIIVATSTPNDYINNLCEKYKIKLFVNTGKTSLADDWNFAISCADTSLVTIAHQDDIYEKEYSSTILKCSNKSDNPLLLFTNYYELRKGQKYTNNYILVVKRILLFPLLLPSLRKNIFIRRRILSIGSVICCPAVTLVKDNLEMPVFEDVFKSNIDWKAWEKISKRQGEFYYCNRMLVGHRIHEDSTTTQIIDGNRRKQEDFLMFRCFWPVGIARCLSKIYSLGEKSNHIKE